MADKTETKIFLLPEAMLINEALFEKDAYTGEDGKPGTPFYKAEMAFDPATVTGQGTIEDELANAAADKWGDAWFDRYFEGHVTTPLLSGDKLAQRRADKGKEGKAYEGKIVIRANTIYNLNGQDAPGGIQCWDEAVKAIGPANRQAIYPGCFGQMAVTIWPYLDGRGDKALKFYLTAFQKTRDGEKLVAARDTSSLFKPVSKPAGEASKTTGRARRAA